MAFIAQPGNTGTAPDRPEPDASLAAKYRALRELQRRLGVDRNVIAAWESNIDRGQRSIRSFLDEEAEWKRFGLKVPDAIYLQLLSTRDNTASVDEFVRQHPQGVKLLASEDATAALSALKQYADACLSRIGVFSWPDLLQQLAERNEGREWLTNTLQQMLRTPGRPTFTPEHGNWQIVALPRETPEVLASAVRAILPARDALECVTADQFVIVHARIIEVAQKRDSSSTVSPL
jgi:hypothetical protein